MGAESIDYTPTIADLERKKAEIERTIAHLRQLMAMGGLTQSGEGGAVPSTVSSFMGGEVPTGAFLGKSIIEATKLYLEIVKKKQTAKEIMDGLLRGGMESSRPKSFLKTVHSALTRARQAPNPPFVKVGMQWGLTSWFPKGISNGSAPKKKVKKNARKPKAPETARVAKPNGKAAPAVVSAAEQRANGKPVSPNTQRLTNIIQSKPGLTLHEIAKEAAMDVQLANRVMINVVRSRKADKRDARYWPAA
jgi:hypothetical protein